MRMSAKVWLGALSLVLAAAWCAAPVRAAKPEAMLPEDAEAVFSVNVENLLNSGLVKKHAIEHLKGFINGNAQLSEILNQLNLDPMKDIRTVTVIASDIKFNAAAGRPEGDASGLIIVQGKFDKDRIQGILEEVAKNMPGKISTGTHGTAKLFEVKEGEKPFVAAFLDKDTIIASDKKAKVTGALDRMGKSGGKLNADLQSALDKADKSTSMWMAMKLPDNVKEMMKANPQSAVLGESLTGIAASVSVKEGVNTDVHFITNNEDAAKQIRVMLESVKGLGAITLADKNGPAGPLGPKLADMIGEMKVTSTGKAVTLKIEAKSELVEDLIKAAKDRTK